MVSTLMTVFFAVVLALLTLTWRMLSVSSSRASASNSRRGWFGLALICPMGTSLMLDEPLVWTSSVEMRASRPRPRAYFLCVAMFGGVAK